MAKTYLQEKLTTSQMNAVNSGITPQKLADIETSISNEISNRINADTNLNNKITINTNNISTLQTNLLNETNSRQQGDAELLTKINNKQNKLTAGTYISIDANSKINCTVQDELNKKIDKSSIKDEVTSTSMTEIAPLKTIKDLNDRINNLSAGGRYLSGWDCANGKPQTDPGSLPYTYKSGDYYIIYAVGTVNYKPNGLIYDGSASTTQEPGNPSLNDYYRFDGTNWSLVKAAASIVEFSTIGGDAKSNGSLKGYLDGLQANITSEKTRAEGAEDALETYCDNLDATKQDLLPTAEKGKYLHSNETTGNLEWKEAGSIYTAGNNIDITDNVIKAKDVVTTNTEQDITAFKYFISNSMPNNYYMRLHNVGLNVRNGSDTDYYTMALNATDINFYHYVNGFVAEKVLYDLDGIKTKEYTLTYPSKSGTIAVTSDIYNKLDKPTSSIGAALQPIYFNGTSLTAGTQLYSKNLNLNGNNYNIVRTTNADSGPFYVHTTGGNEGQISVADSSGKPSWTNKSTLYQEFYDGIYPVGNIQFGFQAPAVPNGVVATWTDISSAHSGRYFRISATQNVGTMEAEALPNITGQFNFTTGTSAGRHNQLHSEDLSGCFSAVGVSDWTSNIGVESAQAACGISMNAHNSNSIYQDGAGVKPLTETIKIWQRTA